tara:strand:+ start:90 stop:815 length:726 start_codon:yes stop_codon:yes gene_type:complete
MKYNLFFLLFFLYSCTTQTSGSKNTSSYSAKGFAYILPLSLMPKTLKEDQFFISHNKFRSGTKIRVINPENEKSLELIIKKKIKYDNFYKILISEAILNQLKLDKNFPYVEVIEIKVNKSFIAEKAVTEKEERLITNKAPIEKININNISKMKLSNIKKNKIKTFSILVAEFYSKESAELLKERIEKIMSNSNYQLIKINKRNEKSFELLMGPYNTINKLKNDYNVLSGSEFENLDIKIND